MATELENRLEIIEKRNQRVEADKAWEGSWTRKISIMILTYLVAASYLEFVVKIDPLDKCNCPSARLSYLNLNNFCT